MCPAFRQRAKSLPNVDNFKRKLEYNLAYYYKWYTLLYPHIRKFHIYYYEFHNVGIGAEADLQNEKQSEEWRKHLERQYFINKTFRQSWLASSAKKKHKTD